MCMRPTEALRQSGFESPNLDGLSISPSELYEAADLLLALSDYARNKAHAMQYRAAGQIDVATYHERQCDLIYQRLPTWARW